MFSGFPPHIRRMLKTSLSSAWLLSAGAGLSALSPAVDVRELGPIWTVLFGGMLAGTAIVAAVGILANRYRWEWAAAWGAAASVAPYVIVLWAATIMDAGKSSQAFLATSLLAFFITRALFCAAHAARQRIAARMETAAVDIVSAEEDDGHGAAGGDGE